MTINISSGITYSCGNGGTLTTIGTADDLAKTGITDTGWAYFDDILINPYDDMTLDVANEKTKATIKHVVGRVIISFGLTSRVPHGKADIKIEGLAPEEWYRLEFDSVLAKTDGGSAHGQTDSNGELIFANVHVPQ